MAKKPIKITEVVLRDAHQSLLATRMTMDEMRPILPEMDKIIAGDFSEVSAEGFRDPIYAEKEDISNMAELSRPIDREFNVEVEGGRWHATASIKYLI